MRSEPARRQLIIMLVAAAAIAGAAGWLLLGPLWTIAGVAAGPPATLVAYAGFRAYTIPDPADHLRDHESYRALTELHRALPT
jgi:hypothetical protein